MQSSQFIIVQPHQAEILDGHGVRPQRGCDRFAPYAPYRSLPTFGQSLHNSQETCLLTSTCHICPTEPAKDCIQI